MKRKAQNPLISVIIPTYNRADLLRLSLQSLVSQSIPKKEFEVIVINDGSRDATADVCKEFKKILPVRHFYQKNSGISAAKNLGIFVSRAPILFFFDDDDVADKNLLKEHLRSHRENPDENAAVLGYTTWHPSLKVSNVMRFMTDVGFLFYYSRLKDGQTLDYTFFWGGRSSCKRSVLVQHGVFNQRFRFGSEDIELGYRLSRFGFKVIFNRRAVSYMVRPLTYDEFCRRCEKQGRSQYWFSLLHPDPAIHRYCMIGMAGEKWQFIGKHLEQKVARVHEIESMMSSGGGEQLPRAVHDEIWNLYWWTFNAFKIKGIVEETAAAREGARTEPTAQTLPEAIPGEALRYFKDKWVSPPRPPEEKERILVIDPLLPMFDRASGSLRLFHILKSLVKLGYEVTFISRDAEHHERYVPILRELGIETYPCDPSALDHIGVNAIAPYVDLEKLLAERHYTAAILDFWHLAEYYLPVIRRCSPSTSVIVDSVDIHFLREIREAELKGDRNLLERSNGNRERELRVYGQADRVWVVTADDRKAIESLIGPVPIDVIPNIHEKIEESKAFEETADLLFVGNFNHRPNIDAVEFFCKDVLPLIRRDLKDIKLYIVGNKPPEAVKAFESENVIVTGYVEDLAPHLKNARISISPLRYGAGMKGKVGEALSWGLPVVTTTIGAEGMGLVDGHDALIADDPREFAAKVVQLYTDSALWARLSTNGRYTVESQWSPEAIRKRLASVLNEIGRKREKVSIVILTFNELEYTKKCVESIRRHTPVPHEIVFVDNGSTDGTVKWLRNLVKDNAGYQLVENRKNLGFAKGCNQGIEAATGDYILLLNNDVVVSEGWLAGMLDCLRGAPEAGIVGPLTNAISGRQKVEHVGYDSLEGFDGYARIFRDRNRHRRIETGRVVGFCMLFRKGLVEKIGLLDESFGTGNFEDDDFCLRALVTGHRNYIAGDVFIHHFGSRSFIGNRIDYGASLAGNRKIFTEKWNAIERKGPEGTFLLSRNIREKAKSLYLRGDLKSAFDLYLEAIRHTPQDSRVYHEFAEALIGAKLFREALDTLKEAPVEGHDKMQIVLTGYGKEGLNDDDEAGRLAERALALDESFARAANLKGIRAYKRQDPREAEINFRRAVECDPSWGEPYTNLGVLKWAAGDKAEGLSFLEKGFILSPTIPEVAAMCYSAAVETGNPERAEEVFREAKALYPDCRHLHFLLIDLLISRGSLEEAMSGIEQAMATFEIDDGFLQAALDIRAKIGPHGRAKNVSKKKGRVSLCMIVKDEEKNIPRCLLSVKPVVDEIIIVDTGSADRTKGICRAFGAKVFDFKWTESFAEARNFSLSKATGDWIFVLDADEVLSSQDHQAFRKVTENAPSRPRACAMVTRNYTNFRQHTGWRANEGQYAEEAGNGWFPSDKVRLFTRDDRIRFSNPVHEFVEPALEKLGVKPIKTAIPVHHYGKLNAGKIREKGEAYYALGKKKLEETGLDAESLRELATQAVELKKYEEAVELWEKLIELKPDMARAYMNLSHACLELGRYAEALEASRTALGLDPAMKEAGFNCAMSEFYAGDPQRTIEILEGLLARTPDYPPAEALLAAAYLVRGRREKAAAHLDILREKGFEDTSFLRVFAEKLKQAGRHDEAGALHESAGLSRHGGTPAERADDGRAAEPAAPTAEKKTAESGAPSLSLCMITRDEEGSITRALSSVAPIVSEMIVVDTGSRDRTQAIAASLGAKVYDFPWSDDFSAARNFSLSKATGDWILVLDADEILSPADAPRLRTLLITAGEDTAGVLLLTRNYTVEMNAEGWTRNDGRYAAEEAAEGWFPSRKVRLFRKDSRIRYEGAVHEMIEPAMERHHLRWIPCDVPVHHYGPLAEKNKGESYYRLGRKKLEEAAEDPRAVYELAVQAGRLRRFGEAIELWQRYFDLNPGEDLPLAFLNLGHAFLETGQYAKSTTASRKALEIDPRLKEASLNLAMAEFYGGRPEKTIQVIESLLSRTGDYPPAAALLCAARLLKGETGKAGEQIFAFSKRDLNLAPFFQVYAARLREAGQEDRSVTLLAAARKIWTHHLRARDLEGSPEEVAQVMSAVEADIPAVQNPVSPKDAGTEPAKPSISLCMIARDEEEAIGRALSSVTPVVCEMIVVDTGSKDRTRDIALGLGAKVYDFPWKDDFSAARNFSLSKATGDWVLVLDADEVISPDDHEKILDLVRKNGNGNGLKHRGGAIGGYALTARNYVDGANVVGWKANDNLYREQAGCGWYPSSKVRLFRRDSRIRFEGAVHEIVEKSMEKAGLKFAPSDIPVHHYGTLRQANDKAKRAAYYLLGRKKLEETGGSLDSILELAVQAGELGRFDEAVELWGKFLERKPGKHLDAAYLNLSQALLNSCRFREALDVSVKAVKASHSGRDALFQHALCEFYAGDVARAASTAEKILRKDPGYPPALALATAAYGAAGDGENLDRCVNLLRKGGADAGVLLQSFGKKLSRAGREDLAQRLFEAAERTGGKRAGLPEVSGFSEERARV